MANFYSAAEHRSRGALWPSFALARIRVIRQHWGIENKLHWMLDVGFDEDLDRKRAGHTAQNFSLLNRIALNLLKQETTFKRGIKAKRLKAAWNHPYLLKLLGV